MTSMVAPKTSHFACHATGIEGRGPLNTEVMVVGIAPAREEMRSLKVYSGRTGQLTEAVLNATGTPSDSVYFTNLLCYWNRDPKFDDIKDCLPRLVREIDAIKPKVIVALGALPIQFFTGLKSKSVRGSCMWSEAFNCWIISTWQPTVVFQVSAGLIADVVRDLAKIQYIKDKPKTLGDVGWELVSSPVQAQQILDSQWLRDAQFPALDVECKWDDLRGRWTSDIRCLSISDGDTTYCYPENLLTGLRWPVEGVNWTFHNAMFDTQRMIEDQNIELPIGDDTMLMSYSLDERGGSDDEEDGVDIAVGIHGLKRLGREYCGAGFYTVNLKTEPDSVVYAYNAKDAAYTSRLATLFYQRQVEEGVRQFYEDMILPEARLCRDEKAYGIFVNQAGLQGLAITWGEEWLRLDDELRDEAVDYGWPEPYFNFNSPPQMKRFLNNYLQLEVTDTRAETLEKFANHPWIAKRIRAKKITKQLGTYVKGIANNLTSDGRIHPDPSIHATVSGRKTYHNPPVGTIPTGAQYMDPDEDPDEETEAEVQEFRGVRKLFSAPTGKVFLEADYSAAELWSAAYLSGDDVMLADLMSGDFHSNAAETMFKCKRGDYSPAQWKNMRRESKYVTFGVLFLRGAMSLFNPAPGQGGNLGKKYKLHEIEEMIRLWHLRYIKHWNWVNATIAEARRTGEQTSVSGRRRRYHAPSVYKQFSNMAGNWPVQTVAHDHLIVARLEFDSLIRSGEFKARTLWDGHDAVYFESDEDYADMACTTIKAVMEKPRWFERGIPVDIQVGFNWAEGHQWPADSKGVGWRDHLDRERAA